MEKDNMKAKIAKCKVQIMLLGMLALAACTFQTKHRGYVFPADLQEQVADIKTTAELVDKVGAPQSKTMYGDEVWIYFGADENYRGPLAPTFTNETVLLAWVRGNRVLKTRVLHDADLPNVVIAEGETEIPAAIELSAIEELFNNIGRFSPAGLGQ
ncbi:MAG: hypothetical protein E7006_02195 [Alphaproteobacteria bacterium]|nr:hypothetical protein [Alphaproteobacteria bacterium]